MITVLALTLISAVFTDADAPPAPCDGCGVLTSITHVCGPFGRQSSCCEDCFESAMAEAAEEDAQREYVAWAESHCDVCELSLEAEAREYGHGCTCLPLVD